MVGIYWMHAHCFIWSKSVAKEAWRIKVESPDYLCAFNCGFIHSQCHAITFAKSFEAHWVATNKSDHLWTLRPCIWMGITRSVVFCCGRPKSNGIISDTTKGVRSKKPWTRVTTQLRLCGLFQSNQSKWEISHLIWKKKTKSDWYLLMFFSTIIKMSAKKKIVPLFVKRRARTFLPPKLPHAHARLWGHIYTIGQTKLHQSCTINGSMLAIMHN